MKIIGFGHRKRVGKDTAAKFALSMLRIDFRKLKTDRLSFGDQLKDLSYRAFSWGGLREAMYYHNHPEEIEVILPAIGKSPRQIWDEMGLTGRNIHPNIWVNMAAHCADGDLLISPDVRFPTEVDLIRKFGGLVIRIDRDSAVKVNTPVDQALADFEGWDFIIKNNGSLRELNQKTLEIVRNYTEQNFDT